MLLSYVASKARFLISELFTDIWFDTIFHFTAIYYDHKTIAAKRKEWKGRSKHPTQRFLNFCPSKWVTRFMICWCVSHTTWYMIIRCRSFYFLMTKFEEKWVFDIYLFKNRSRSSKCKCTSKPKNDSPDINYWIKLTTRISSKSFDTRLQHEKEQLPWHRTTNSRITGVRKLAILETSS